MKEEDYFKIKKDIAILFAAVWVFILFIFTIVMVKLIEIENKLNIIQITNT